MNWHVRMLRWAVPTILALVLAPLGVLTEPGTAAQTVSSATASDGMFNLSPAGFEQEAGSDANFRVHLKGTSVHLGPEGLVFAEQPQSTAQASTRLQFLGANENMTVEGVHLRPSTTNYFLGNDPAKWRTNVATFGEVLYRNLFPGINLSYGVTDDGQLRATYTVSAGANASLIRWSYRDARSVSIDPNGHLLIQPVTADMPAPITERVPVAWQEINGRRLPVSCSYELGPDASIGYRLGAYDKAYDLLISPTLTVSTYLGGSGSDSADDVVVDSDGNIYVAGYAQGTDFPLVNSVQPGYGGGGYDVFVAKLDPTGTRLLYSSYLGGSRDEYALALAVDNEDNVYLTGDTSSDDFPTVGSYQPRKAGATNAFVAKLSAAGSVLLYSTYLGGSSNTRGWAIAEQAGSVYVAGYTDGDDFPVKGGVQITRSGSYDCFIARLDPTGAALVYSTYLGGKGFDVCTGLKVDSAGSAYLVGRTESSDFPLASALVSTFQGREKAFITKLDPSGSALIYSTLLGGSNREEANGVAIDGTGSVYVTGLTDSSDFPTAGAPQLHRQPSNFSTDAFVARLNPSGSTLLYATHLGGSQGDVGYGIAVDRQGVIYVTGVTTSIDFPVANALQTAYGGGNSDTFVTVLDTTAQSLLYSTYLGGSKDEAGNAIAVGGQGNPTIAGYTTSPDFPTRNALFPRPIGSLDAFAAQLSLKTTTSTPTPSVVPTVSIPGSNSFTFPETGKRVTGLFLDRWERNGGLAVNGYPISGVLGEVSDLDGRPYTVQYFERAVFEYHPENQGNFNVLLAQLGTFAYGQKYRTGAPHQQANKAGTLFAETGHWVGGWFLEYWEAHGGLMQFGYPLSDEFVERSSLNGKEYLVQYFERAVFELHPENSPPNEVLLSQLGTLRYREKYGGK